MDMKKGLNLKEDIQLVLCDIDGTLLTSKHEVSQATLKAIDALRAKGKCFGLATGRPIANVLHLLKEWRLEQRCDFIVGSNGAQVLDRRCDRILEQNFLSKENIRTLIQKYQDQEISLCVYEGNTLVTNRLTPEYEHRCRVANLGSKVTDLSEFVQKAYPKMLFVSSQAVQKQILDEYVQNDWYALVPSGTILTEVIDPSLNKVNGIQRVCEILGIQKENVLCFGDEMNDYSMLNFFVGVAMGNAILPIQKLCHYHALSNDENGVADFLLKRVI